MTLFNILETIFVITFIMTIVFWFLKKKRYCFLCSLVAMLSFLVIGLLQQHWVTVVFFTAGIAFDLYSYKTDSWDMFGFFDE